MCKGCSMKCGNMYYLTEVFPLSQNIIQSMKEYEKVIRNIPEMKKHHRAVVKLRRLINNELNSWEPAVREDDEHWVNGVGRPSEIFTRNFNNNEWTSSNKKEKE